MNRYPYPLLPPPHLQIGNQNTASQQHQSLFLSQQLLYITRHFVLTINQLCIAISRFTLQKVLMWVGYGHHIILPPALFNRKLKPVNVLMVSVKIKQDLHLRRVNVYFKPG